ncbi:multicopper oxidase family protein [Kitasatospora sp. NPDC004240]
MTRPGGDRRVSRRRFLRLGAVGLGAGAAVAVGGPVAARLLSEARPGLLLPSEVEPPPAFGRPFVVPPVLAPVAADAAGDHYELVQKPVRLEILPGLPTEVWTYGGSFPGPTVVARAGRPVVVRHRNELPVPVTVHLHGGHTPADSDGYPMDLLHPVGTAVPAWSAQEARPAHREHAGRTGQVSVGERTYTYPGQQRAATLWYHDHRMGFTGQVVWHGLAGFHLVHDEEEDALPLPRGERDLPVMLADRSFAEDGSFRYPAADERQGVTEDYLNGVLGDVILVNGTPWPALAVDRARYRLRLLNGANTRLFRLELDPQPPGGGALVQIGSDGGLLEAPLAHDTLDLAPAERFDVVVDFARYPAGTRVRLMNRFGSDRTTEVMCFDVSGRAVRDDSAVPARLSRFDRLDPGAVAATRTFAFRRSRRYGWAINNLPYEPGRPLARPALGSTEIWRFTTDVHHPVHVHLNHFQVLSRDGGDPGPYDAGWKDTVDLRPSETMEVLVRFTDHPGTYMLHCHNLEHEDTAMMGDFVVE